MTSHKTFKKFILPKLIETAQHFQVLENVVSISLYGSANYSNYNQNNGPSTFDPEKSDFDVWIVFNQDRLDCAKIFAKALFGVSFDLIPNTKACILYEKIRIQTNAGLLLIAPMILTENCYLLLENPTCISGKNITIPWYRPRARDRLAKVPICSTSLAWSEFDMLQTYLPNINLWRLQIPVITYQQEIASLGSFLECAFSGDCFYGDHQKENNLKRNLFLNTLTQLYPRKDVVKESIPPTIYQMMTLATKASSTFRKRKLRQFYHWLSE